MIAQYTAASLASENKILASPASVDTIPSSANQEDHVSMGTTAARKLARVVSQTRQVVAIELLAGAQALDLRAELDGIASLTTALGRSTSRLYQLIRAAVPAMAADRELSPDILALDALIATGTVGRAIADC
jgi:histidine ammonia-lyase